jgi:hypothetical protein
MCKLLKSALLREGGQSLVEYSLLLAFVALSASALFIGSGNSTSGIWASSNAHLSTANVTAAGTEASGTDTPPPSGGGHDHDHHH